MDNEWRDTEYEGYEVSSDGWIRSKERLVKQGNRFMKVKQKLLMQHRDKCGYLNVRISANDIIKTVLVHRLVLEAFIPNPDSKPQCNHKDGNKTNNHVSNLEWCTNRENHIHAIETGLHKSANGERAAHSKITEHDVEHARELCSIDGVSTSLIAKILGINKASCREMLIGKTWKHVDYLIEECKTALTSRIGRNQYV